MGSNGSKVAQETALHDKDVLERLRAMHIQSHDKSDEGYVYVGDHKSEPADQVDEKAARALKSRTPENISVSQMGAWQKCLLQDPKNRQV